MEPATIKLFLVRGSPDSLRTAELSNWAGKALTAPRTELKHLLARSELVSPGIYLLTGFESESDAEKPAIYIGEAENVRKRLRTGHSSKDFWNNVTVFVAKDQNLTKAHVRYLEGRLIEIAQRRTNLAVMNSTTSGSPLPESDEAEMNVFLEKLLQLLPVLGVPYLKRTPEPDKGGPPIFTCKVKGVVARGRRTPDGFIVFKDSEAVLTPIPSAKWAKKRRDQMVGDGLLVEAGDRLKFDKDVEFGSPSMAARVINGGSINGMTCWKNEGGVSLKDWESEGGEGAG